MNLNLSFWRDDLIVRRIETNISGFPSPSTAPPVIMKMINGDEEEDDLEGEEAEEQGRGEGEEVEGQGVGEEEEGLGGGGTRDNGDDH